MDGRSQTPNRPTGLETKLPQRHHRLGRAAIKRKQQPRLASRQAAVQNKAWGARKDHGEPSAAKTTIAPWAKRDEIPRTLVSGARNEHVESSVTKTTMAPWAKREEKPNTSAVMHAGSWTDLPLSPWTFPRCGGSSSASKGDTCFKAGAWGKQNPQAVDVTRSAWGTVTKSSSSPSTTERETDGEHQTVKV